MPVAFLEPQFNKFNKNSILFGIEEDMIATHSLEAKGTVNLYTLHYFNQPFCVINNILDNSSFGTLFESKVSKSLV